jgi:hypothetical protein
VKGTAYWGESIFTTFCTLKIEADGYLEKFVFPAKLHGVTNENTRTLTIAIVKPSSLTSLLEDSNKICHPNILLANYKIQIY